MNSATPLRWGANAPDDITTAQARLLDSAEACFEQYGIMKTTVEDIARVAHVSRATVYRYFDGRDALVLGVLLRDTDRHLSRIRARIERQANLGEAIAEFVDLTVRAARRDASLGLLFTGEAARMTGGIIAGASVELFERVTAFLRPLFERWSTQVRPGTDIADASEWILRAVLSILTVEGPKRRSREAQRAFVERYLIPAIVR
ncbi:MAG: TetR family transcriptional regulator [Acidimicrobiia bacterium]|nr:TetR family transcriptional regulator [Acidimicrobiia bacterium]